MRKKMIRDINAHEEYIAQKNTKGKTEKGKIKKKIQRINEAAKRARRGENHSQAEKR